MRQYIHDKLREITEEEKNILEGNYIIDKSIYEKYTLLRDF